MDSSSPISSSSSSRAASPELQPTIPIFIKNISGSTIPLTLPPTLSIQNLTTLLSLRTSLPSSDLRLVYAGKHLSTPSNTLQDYNINRDSTIHLAIPMRGGMPPKKPKCEVDGCKERAQRIIGDCTFCQGHFCGDHRLLEDHKCSGLEDCKQEARDLNTTKLESERTQVIRGI
ncbi:hypothetical protein B7494_g6998 [Chlorociboria aeruginascens]|nr:hypothetical protein B7494_g6998 [Chlorociboria aeruginascens]